MKIFTIVIAGLFFSWWFVALFKAIRQAQYESGLVERYRFQYSKGMITLEELNKFERIYNHKLTKVF